MDSVTLTVNGEAAPEGALEAEIGALMGRFRQLPPEQLQQYGFTTPEAMRAKAVEWAQENVVERMLLRQEALKDAEPVPEDVLQKAVDEAVERFGGKEKLAEAGHTEEELRRDAEAEAKIQKLIDSLTAHLKPPKQKDIAEFYRKRREQFRVPESVNAAHILKSVNEEVSAEAAKKAIDEAKAELDAGADFAEVAAQRSDAPAELGWFPRGRMVPRFDEVAFGLEVGQVSAPFKTTFGFHIVKVLDSRPESQRPLSEVRDLVEREIMTQKRNEVLEAFIDKARAAASVDFDPAADR
jgi:parvulin-like peptidyl-prolyl isomerase